MKHHNYYVYILTNPGRTVLYTGVTNNLDRRLAQHVAAFNEKRNCFTSRYNCLNLIYYEWYFNILEAIAREKEIKGWKRWKKEKLISTFNPEWCFLNDPSQIAKGNLPVWYVGDDYWRPASDKHQCNAKQSEASGQE